MSNKTNTKIKSTAITEHIPNEGPALHSDVGAYTARIDQDLAAIRDNRAFWNKIDGQSPSTPEKKKQVSKLIFNTAIGATAVTALVARHHEINQQQDPVRSDANTPALTDSAFSTRP